MSMNANGKKVSKEKSIYQSLKAYARYRFKSILYYVHLLPGAI